MLDPYGRQIINLRISVTQRCNLSCPYCHREGEIAPDREMTADVIEKLTRCAASLGVKKVKLTGGEPLLRQDIVEIVARINRIAGIEEVSMTTNGLLLERFAAALATAGLKRVNIGCDLLSSSISSSSVSSPGRKSIEKVLPGIEAAKKAGLAPIKLNVVVLKGVNHTEIENMMGLAAEHNVILQLIELLPVKEDFYRKHFFPLDLIEQDLNKRADEVITRKMHHRKQYRLNGVVVEIVRSHLNRWFCENCRTIRITSDGQLKPCLLRYDNLVKIEDTEDLEKYFRTAVARREPYYR